MSTETRIDPPASIEQWEELVSRCTEAATVRESGERLTCLLPNVRCCGPLMQLAVESSRPAVRELAAVLLHGHMAHYWNKLKQPAREAIKKGLLRAIVREQERSAAVALVELTAATAIMCVPLTEKWPELMPFVRSAVSPAAKSGESGGEEWRGMGSPRVRVLGARLLRALLNGLPQEFRAQLQGIVQFLLSGVKEAGNKELRLLSLQSLTECVNVVSKPKEAAALVPAVPAVIAYLRESLARTDSDDDDDDEDQQIACIDFLSDLMSCDVPVAAGKLGVLMGLFFEVCGKRTHSQYVRNHGLLWFTHAASYAKKELLASGKLGVVVTLALSYAAEFNDDDADAKLALTPYEAGCELIDHLIQTIKPSRMYKPTAALINGWLKSTNPLQRRVAIAVLGLMGVTYQEEVAADLPKILPLVAGAMARDASSVVREAACLAMAMLAGHVQPEMSQQHKQLLPVLVRAVDDPDAEVRPKAIHALNVYCEHLDFDLGPYLRPLVAKLVKILYTAPAVQEQEMALSSIAAVAAAADHQFAPYAAPVLKFCKQAMECNDPERLALRARATECLGLVALSLGAEHMSKYCRGFMQLAMQGFKLKRAHELSEYTLSMFSNFCLMLKHDFLPYCKAVVPLVVHIALLNENDDDAPLARAYLGRPAAPPSSPSLSLKPVQKRSSSTRESFIDEKSTAVQALGVFANALGPAFAPWLQDSINTVLGLVNFYHPDVRKAAFVALAELLGAVYLTFPADELWQPGVINNKTVHAKFYEIFDKVFEVFPAAMLGEPSPDVVSTAVEACGRVVLIVGPAALRKKYLEQLKLAIFALLSRKTSCQRNRGDDIDPDDDRDIVQLYYDATDLLLELSKVFAGQFQPVFEAALPMLANFAGEASPIPYREGAVGTIAELLRSMDVSAPYLQKLWPLVQAAAQQKLGGGGGLRRNAAYCVGIMAMTGGKAVLPMLGKMANLLRPLLATDRSACSDNAAGSLARILLHGLAHNQPLPFAQIVEAIVSALPIHTDYEPLSPIVDCVVETYQLAFRDPANPNSQALVALSPQVLTKLGPLLGQSATYRAHKAQRNNPLTPEQESRIIDDELEPLLVGLFRKLLTQFSAKLDPVVAAFSPDVREAFLAALRRSDSSTDQDDHNDD